VKTILFTFFATTATLLFLFSCQKEIRFISQGELVRDANNNCKPVIVTGHFISGNYLSAADHLEVEVHFAAIGAYTIATDTVNGYFFNAEGNVKDTGFTSIKLSGHGKPLNAGNDQFRIVYGNSSCTASVRVLNAASTASFTLEGSPNSCIDTVVGGYIKGVSMDPSSHVIIEVNVTTPGIYSVSTDTVNGYTFSSAGTFSFPGEQVISLVASGTPLNAGTDVFTLNAGPSTCTFSITVLSAFVATNNDLFPLSINSFWNYDDTFYGNVKTSIIDTGTHNGNLYTVMEEQINPTGPVLHLYRRAGADYYEYMVIDGYTSSLHYGKRIYDDILFLKENLSTGDTWETKEFTDTADFGQVLVLQYRFACVASNTSVVVGTNAFSHVYEVEMVPWLRTVNGPYGQANEKYKWYYAKGVGLIYRKTLSVGFNYGEQNIKNWHVN